MWILLALVVTTLAEPLTVEELLTTPMPEKAEELKGKKLVDFVNHRQSSFVAEYSPNAMRYFPLNPVDEEDEDPSTEAPIMKANLYHNAEDSTTLPPLPESFDAREHWKNCSDIIDYIRDQSACGGCWAVAAASAMSDRACIESNGKYKKHLSAIDIISCCNDCGYGCSGGQALKAWNYAIREGVPTGGRYGTEGVCKPYYFHPCGRHANQTYYGECPLAHRTPQCFKACHPYYPVGYNEDKIFGKTAYQLPNDEKAIMREIMTNGPVAASMRLHADFAFYRRGVYINTGGRDRGGHAVKIIGWGTENGTPYWLIANSYNFDWGEKGYFRMIRGKNNCKIEEKVVAGTMNVEKYL